MMIRYTVWGVVRTLVVASIAGAVLGCASAPAATGAGGSAGRVAEPAWYSNPASVYPDNLYISAVGSGSSRRNAEADALGALSQVFRAEVTVDQSMQERYRELAGASGTLSQTEIEMTQSIDIRSSQTLLNVQYGDSFTDERGRVHVIGYIERAPTARVYSELIAKNGAQVASFTAQARAGTDLLRRYAYLSAAAVVATNNEVLRDQLRIISPAAGLAVRVPYNYDQLLQERADVAAQVTTSIALEGDAGGRIDGAVRRALSQERFPVAASGVLAVRGQVRMESVDLNPQFKTVRWHLNLQLVDPNGVTLVTMDRQERASGINDDAARAFAYNDITKAIEADFVAEIRRYFDRLVLGG